MLSQYSTSMVSRAILQRTSHVVTTRLQTKGTTMIAKSRKQTWMSTETTTTTTTTAKPTNTGTSWWSDPKFWGGLGAMAGWGMSGSAIYDATIQGPEVISLTMTPVLIVYSTLFARWAYIVTPPNPLLMYCHIANVTAQLNQLRRALQYKIEQGEEEHVKEMASKVAMGGAATAVAVAAGPKARTLLSGAGLGVISTIAAADAGPFTVHFWAPMSKWLISGASFFELDRPTDKISLPQYSALTLTGFFFSRYALLVTPINYTLCSVNIALFVSSAWHLGRKIKADYMDEKDEETKE